MKKVYISFLLILIIFFSACRASEEVVNSEVHSMNSSTASIIVCRQPTEGGVVESNVHQTAISGVNVDEEGFFVEGNNTFAFKLYQQLIKNKEGNLFYSPYGISLSLAMINSGAHDETAKEITDTLHFNLPQYDLHLNTSNLNTKLAGLDEDNEMNSNVEFRPNVTNTIWGQDNYTFFPEFLNLLMENYSIRLKTLDFINEGQQSRTAINKWINDQMEDRISWSIPQTMINQSTRLVLNNSTLLNTTWHIPFDSQSIKEGSFYLVDDVEIIVEMMNQTGAYGYFEQQDYRAVELPCDDGISIVIILPDLDQFKHFETTLDIREAEYIIEKLRQSPVKMVMPKFKFNSEFSLRSPLVNMGMLLAFSESADFSGIGNPGLYIDEMQHMSFVSVSERDTTDVRKKEEPIEYDFVIGMTIDHPFIFLIRDIETGTILFLGRVLNPLE